MNTPRLLHVWALLAPLAMGCGEVETTAPAPTTTRQIAIGEPVVDAPTWSERAVLYLTNRARVEPTAFNADEPYEPSTPLRFDYPLTLAARFHAAHIEDANCWCEDHSSCCELEKVGDDVMCAAPPAGCGLTDAATRVSLWSSAYRGENMARGYPSPEAVVDGWIHSSGHWANMNDPGHRTLGVGHIGSAWVQDFGGGPAPAVVSDGIHLNAGSSTTFGITYHQPGTGGPQSAMVIVEGECIDLDLAYGEDPGLAAYEVNRTLGTGCHRYYFFIRDGAGNDITYPSRGSLGAAIGVGESECPLYLEERPADTCSPAGQTCETGEARSCYTGPFGTRDTGICESGFERCIAGSWTGECTDEIGPEPEEICDNGLDDNCDGAVDEGCAPEEDAGVTSDTPDMGDDEGASNPDGTAKDKASAEGCSAAPHGAESSPLHLLLGGLLAMMFAARRRF